MTEYPIVILPLSEEDGGGFIATFPDLPGCFSDGDTPLEAVENALDAFACWVEVQKDRGEEIPEPNSSTKRVSEALKTLVDSVDALAQYVDAADEHMKALERAIGSAIENLDDNLLHKGATFANANTKEHIRAIH